MQRSCEAQHLSHLVPRQMLTCTQTDRQIYVLTLVTQIPRSVTFYTVAPAHTTLPNNMVQVAAGFFQVMEEEDAAV